MGFTMDYDQDYFKWLCELTHVDDDPDASWHLLAETLNDISFTPFVEHDDNRSYDGIALREEYLTLTNYPKYLTLDGPCNALELMYGLARRMAFETSDPYDPDENDDGLAADWFWELVDNLGLTKYDDEHFVELDGENKVREVLNNVMNRDYEPDGKGGFFPLEHPKEDQRNVELWRQMSAYLTEKGSV